MRFQKINQIVDPEFIEGSILSKVNTEQSQNIEKF
jgi:hypothetical protein